MTSAVSGRAKLHADLDGLVGTVIHDRYRVEALLGVGGMGAVFRAHHLGLRRDVALKVLHPEIGRDEAVSKRFDREATSASRLDHPNCVRVTDFGTTENGTKYLVMEFLAGHELKDSLGKALPPAEAVRIAIQIFQGLEHAHHFGVVHRDLKPENIYVTTDFRGHEVVKIVDFGIAKLIDEQGAQEKLTRAGLVFGTPRYMSPEQASGGKIDERTDLYAAGLILYEMLRGDVPFVADEPGQLLRMQILAPPPPLPASVPPALAKVVDKLLEKAKSDRYSSAREVIDALGSIERELSSLPAPAPAPAPVVVPTPASSPTHATSSGRSQSSWQPVAPTSSLPPAPPPPAAGMSGIHGTVPPPPAAPSLPGTPVAAVAVGASTSSHPTMPTGLAPTIPASSQHSSQTAPTVESARSSGSRSATTDPSISSAGVNRSTHPSTPVVVVPAPTPTSSRKAWLPWAIVGVAIFVALMAVGALLSASEDTPDSTSAPGSSTSPSATSSSEALIGSDDASDSASARELEEQREAAKKREEMLREEAKRREEKKRKKHKGKGD